uniref:Uncharacterized protein n=1 Tax=Meloidogyne enterolobii TaxID=390850 RepID=A0A6V7TZH8_MELEN|nr:unnamed protein product [Meloidogyne enterolobii]
MFLIKFLFVSQIFFLIFSFCFSFYKINQRILVESTESNKNEDGSFKIKLLKMELSESNEESVNAKNENDVYFFGKFGKCNYKDTLMHPTTVVKSTDKNGNKLLEIENISIYCRYGISICSSVRNGYKELMTLLPIFNGQINLEANQLSEDNIAGNNIYYRKNIDINGGRAWEI